MAEEGGGILSGLLSSDFIQQMFLWSVVSQMVTTAMQPFFNQLSSDVNSKTPDVPPSPADLADAVVRGFMDSDTAAAQAARSGVPADNFAHMVDLAGDAPGPQQLAEALRRGFIPYDSGDPTAAGFVQGIQQGRLADKWAKMIEDLSTISPTPALALNALLKGQVDYNTGLELYKKFGGDPAYFTLAYNTDGNAPSPTEAGLMTRRGIIPMSGTGPNAVSYEQAFLEGPWRNKWSKPFYALSEYYPTVTEVRTFYEHGAIDEATAKELWSHQGVSAQNQDRMLASVSATRVEGAKQITVQVVEKLYHERVLTHDEAQGLLTEQGYTPEEADYILAAQDMLLEQRFLTAAISKIHTLFVARKVSPAEAQSALAQLSVPTGQIGEILSLWDVEQKANVRMLTEGQIVDAWAYGIISYDQAVTDLVGLGYSQEHAAVLVEIKNKGPIQGPTPTPHSGAKPV